jgi:hypothetical protein
MGFAFISFAWRLALPVAASGHCKRIANVRAHPLIVRNDLTQWIGA